MDPLVDFHLHIDDFFSLALFFILQYFMAVSTFKYWRQRTMKHTFNCNLTINGETIETSEQ